MTLGKKEKKTCQERKLVFTCPLGFISMTSFDLCSIFSKDRSLQWQSFSSFSSRVIMILQQGGEPEPHSRVMSLAMFPDGWCLTATGVVNEGSDLNSSAPVLLVAAYIRRSSPLTTWLVVSPHPRQHYQPQLVWFTPSPSMLNPALAWKEYLH